MQKKLRFVAAKQAKENLHAEINRMMVEKHALIQSAEQTIKKAHQSVSEVVANQIAQRIGVSSEMLNRLVNNVFGFEQVLSNLEPIKFQPYVHLKEMSQLRELLNIMETNGLIEIDHIFTNLDEKRFLINSFLSEVKTNINKGRYVNPLNSEVMAKHEFYRHYFQVIHTTEKYMKWVEEAIKQDGVEVEVANDLNCEQYQAVA